MANTCSHGRDALCCHRRPDLCAQRPVPTVSAAATHSTRVEAPHLLQPAAAAGFADAQFSRNATVGTILLNLDTVEPRHRRTSASVTLAGPAIIGCVRIEDLHSANCSVREPGVYRLLLDDRAVSELRVLPGVRWRPPSQPCTRSGEPARWVQRGHVCQGDVQHPLCAVPAADRGWQLVPHACYHRAWSASELARALADKSLLFIGDSTQRFLWGQFINLFEPNETRQFRQGGYGSMTSPRLSRGSFGACDRFRLNEWRLGTTRITYMQLIYARDMHKCGPGTRYDAHTDTFHVTKKGSQCQVRVNASWAALEAYLASTRVDAVLLQVPTMQEACNRRAGATSAAIVADEPALRGFVPMLRRLQPAASVARRGVTGWASASVPSDHCLRRDGVESLEEALRVAPRPATFGADDAAWRRFASEPFEMWALTSSLYRVEPSDGVHVTAKANGAFAHLLATHLLRTVLPRRAVD